VILLLFPFFVLSNNLRVERLCIMRDTDNLFETFRRSRCEIDKLLHRIMSKCKFVHSALTSSHRHIFYLRARFANLLRNTKIRNMNFSVLSSFERLVLSCFKIIKHKCDAIFSAIVLAYDLILTYTHFLHCCGTRHPLQGFQFTVLHLKRMHEASMICRQQRKTHFT